MPPASPRCATAGIPGSLADLERREPRTAGRGVRGGLRARGHRPRRPGLGDLVGARRAGCGRSGGPVAVRVP
jgi:hypothetical protein